MSKRPDWDTYFMQIARLISERATCLRRKVGAVIVKDRRILATGYNGTPTGITHCEITGCLREKLNVPSGERHELCRGLHAEQNALLQAALHGISLSGDAGIKEIIISDGYPDELAEEMLKEAKINVRTRKGINA